MNNNDKNKVCMSHRNAMSCLNVRDLMHFIWEVHWDTSPLWLVLTHTLQYLCSLWYYAAFFPSWYLVVWVCTSSTSSPTEYSYTNPPAGQCAHSWVVCREVQHIQLCLDWKGKAQAHAKMYLWKNRSHYITCDSYSIPNNGIIYWVFIKVLKPYATLMLK